MWLAGPDEIYIQYHESEWSVPEYDGQILWQMFVLESFQAGLSWITILRRRKSFFRYLMGLIQIILSLGEKLK